MTPKPLRAPSMEKLLANRMPPSTRRLLPDGFPTSLATSSFTPGSLPSAMPTYPPADAVVEIAMSPVATRSAVFMLACASTPYATFQVVGTTTPRWGSVAQLSHEPAHNWRMPAAGRTRAAINDGYSVARMLIRLPAAAAAATDQPSTCTGS